MAILDRLGEATPAQISGQLGLEEESVDPAAVRATLTHLLGQGRVVRARRGVYRLP